MREKAPKIVLQLVVISLIASSGWVGAAWAQDALLPEGPPELIVLLAEGPGVSSSEEIVETSRRGLPLPAGLAEGDPIKARFLIQQRATGLARESLLQEADTPRARLERYLVLTYPARTDIAAVMGRLRRLRSVASVEPNRLYRLAVSPSDPLFQNQWGLPAVNLPSAWDLAPDYGHGYVGVVDTGIDVDHEDLRENTTPGLLGTGNFRAHLSWDFTFNDSNVDEGEFQTPASLCPAGTPNVVGSAGHGTHVAGIIGATTNNGLGVAGACGNCALVIGKASQLRRSCSSSPCTVNNCTYASDSLPTAALIAAISGLVDRGVQALSMSFGRSTNIPDCSQPGAYCDALAHANGRDVVMAAASGNGGSAAVDFPARDPRVIAVGGIIPGGTFWGACDPALDLPNSCPSNFGPEQELVAPARAVLSTFYLGLPYGGAGTACDDSAGVGGPGYGPCSGTSMSTPHVAASATLLRSINPLLSQAQIRSLLIGRASQNGVHDNQMGYGVPNVAASAQDALGRVAGNVLANRLTPLFSLYSSGAEDSLYTSVPQMAAAAYHDALAGYGTTGPSTPGYPEFPDVFCSVSPCVPPTPGGSVYVFTTPKSPRPDLSLPPLVPLYRLTFRGPNPVTGNPLNRDTTYTTEAGGIQTFEAVGYKWDGIEGYIFGKCTPEPGCIPAGAVKLLRRYNSQRDDFAIFPESELAAMEAAGYTSLGGSNLSGYLGYVYPNVDTDGDNLIDGFETILGTSITQPDTDCDGLADGHEVLTFPYGDPRGAPGCQPLNLQWIGQSVPTTMVAGQSYSVSLTVKNTGTQSWSLIGPQCNAFRLGSSNPRDNTTWGFGRVELPSPVASGQQITIPFTVTAPANPASYNFQWQMVHECVQWFGAPSSNVVVAVQNQPPTARFAFSCSLLSCSFDSSTSTDDGLITARNWSVGGSSFGSGVTASRAFAATGSYTVTLTVTDNGGLQSSVSKKVSVNGEAPLPAENYFAVTPCRFLDTRSGPPLNGNQWHVFNIAGSCGIPATAKAVSFNVGVVAATAQGFLLFSPGNQSFGPFPHSTLNFVASPERRFNNAVLRLATNGAGTLALWPAAAPQLHLLLDVYGYFSEDTTPAPGAIGPLGFQTLAPCRVLDTRGSSALTQGVSRSFTLQGVCGVPAGAPVAAVNLTAVSPSDAGNVRIFRSDVDAVATLPSVQFPAGTSAQANGARTPLASTTLDAKVLFSSSNPAATSHAVVDVYGYFSSTAPLRYRPITPCRLLDTRSADQGAPAFAGPESRNIQVQGNCGVPLGAKAAVLNVTSVSPAGLGHLVLYPAGAPFPVASVLNFDPAQGGALANGVVVGLSAQPNDLAVTCAVSPTHVVIDVFGYFQ